MPTRPAGPSIDANIESAGAPSARRVQVLQPSREGGGGGGGGGAQASVGVGGCPSKANRVIAGSTVRTYKGEKLTVTSSNQHTV